jgi:hypothetical protein
MFSRTVRTIIFSIIVSISGIAATTASSQAGSRHFEFRIEAPGVHLSSGRGYRDHRGYRSHRRYDRRDRRSRHNGGYNYRRGVCAPRKALRKARRMGVRRAHIARVNRHEVVVKGYRYGGRAKVKFGRSRHCPVVAFRTR